MNFLATQRENIHIIKIVCVGCLGCGEERKGTGTTFYPKNRKTGPKVGAKHESKNYSQSGIEKGGQGVIGGGFMLKK